MKVLTHMAINRKTGEFAKVYRDEDIRKWCQSSVVELIDGEWIIVELTVVCAAIKFDYYTVFLIGVRHWDSLMHSQFDSFFGDLGGKPKGEVQGFIDQYGKFLTREEAMAMVKSNGQAFDLERNGGSDDKLYSEGLY